MVRCVCEFNVCNEQPQAMDVCEDCGYNECMNKKFTIVLPEGFENRLVYFRIIYLLYCIFSKTGKKYVLKCVLLVFLQIIPCRYRRDFLEHIHVAIWDHPRTLEVNLVSFRVPDHQHIVLVTNEDGKTIGSPTL